jgi:hypothetical protein
MSSHPLRIGNFSGYEADRWSALADVLAGDDLDVAFGDYLAEITLASPGHAARQGRLNAAMCRGSLSSSRRALRLSRTAGRALSPMPADSIRGRSSSISTNRPGLHRRRRSAYSVVAHERRADCGFDAYVGGQLPRSACFA